MTARSETVHGSVAPGFEPVREAFARNFSGRGELGAACAVFRQSRKVVDLWGGARDDRTRAPWQEDTLVPVFSSTKGFAAMTLAVANGRGWLEYDGKVAAYWPEFAHNGKQDITVRTLLGHRAGLCTLDGLRLRAFADFDTSAQAASLAEKKPLWEPGTRQGYHCWTIGWYMGELLRRVDPRHRSLGRFFREEIAGPLGAEFHIGLPPETPQERIAVLHGGMNSVFQLFSHLREMDTRILFQFFNPWSLTWRSMIDPKQLLKHDNFNRRELQSVEMPAGNGIGSARGMALLFHEFAAGGKKLGLTPEFLADLESPVALPPGEKIDRVARMDFRFSLGFAKPSPDLPFGTSSRAFGIGGAGGSLAFADPDPGIGYAYVMNHMGFSVSGDPRERAVREAVYGCL
ncbi:MAG: beta-lactamase family protein [Anaerolineales bacterium]|nr:beta-lactamase family protein [Anaerolineales bacterium]